MENQKLTQRPQAAAITENALIHVVEPFDISQGASGSSYKFPAASLFIAGQDNIDIKKYVIVGANDNLNTIVSKINTLPQYTVSEKQSVWFIATQGRRSVPGLYSPDRILKFKMMNKGKGTYGLGAMQLTANDVELVYSNEETVSDIEADPVTAIIEFGELGDVSVSEWLNNQLAEIVIRPQDEGYTLFQGTIATVPVSYLWLGEPGVYGQGEQQSAHEDFQTLDDTIPQYDDNAPYIRNVGLIETLPVAVGMRQKLNALTTVITPIDTPVLFTGYTLGETGAGTAHTFLFLGGKGTWGAGGNHIFGAMLYPLLEKPINAGEIEDNDTTLIIPLGEIEEGGFLDAVNSEEHDLTDAGREYYFSYYIGGTLYLALFTGALGVYGGELGSDDFIDADFAQVTNGNITGVPTLQQVNADGGGTTDPLVVTGANSKLVHFADSIEFSGPGSYTQRSVFHETEHDSVYNHPVNKSGEHTYAMLSDVAVDFGKIIKIGKGFTITDGGIITPNSGGMGEHEKGDLFRGVSANGKYIPYMRYNGSGDVADFANHSYELEMNALLPGEPGYILPEE